MTDSGQPSARTPRAVPVANVAAWYGEAMALFRRSPGRFMLLAAISVGTEILLGFVPVAGVPLANMVVPLITAGLMYASLAADRKEPVRLRFAVLAFGAPVAAVAAVILASVVVFGAQAATAAWLGGVNLLAPGGADAAPTAVLIAAFAAGTAASLPVTFVPFTALFDGEGLGSSFRASLAAFARNLPALAVYGLAAYGLAILGLVTYGLGLLVAIPLWAASSYAAWKDIFGVRP